MRYLSDAITEDLSEKMVFLGGPRQCGKTTFAKELLHAAKNGTYFNWDNRKDQPAIVNGNWPEGTDLLVFDEIHKYRAWKSLLKGYWDTRETKMKIFATGSARLDIYRRGGDSLLGRYHYYRMHPFSAAELAGLKPAFKFQKTPPKLDFSRRSPDIGKLFRFGCFPEPLFKEDDRSLSRWQKQRFERVFREDIRSWELVQDLANLELLGDLIPHRVGSPISMASLAQVLSVSPKSIKLWLEVLNRNYFIFDVKPYHGRLERTLKKESKFYLWDYSVIEDKGARFENMVASHLLKFCHYFRDYLGLSLDLHFIRDREKREVDFLLVFEKKPWLMVEAKLTKPDSLTSLEYFAEKLHVKERIVVTMDEKSDYFDRRRSVAIMPASKLFAALV